MYYLNSSPLVAGLVHRVIVQSAGFCPTTLERSVGAAEWLLAGGTAVAAGRTSPDAAAGSAAEPAASEGGPAAPAAAPADGGLDQSSAFHGAPPQRSRHFSHRAPRSPG